MSLQSIIKLWEPLSLSVKGNIIGHLVIKRIKLDVKQTVKWKQKKYARIFSHTGVMCTHSEMKLYAMGNISFKMGKEVNSHIIHETKEYTHTHNN